MIIAVDFDGTIVEHKFPEIGKPIPFAIETLKMLQQERHQLILWTVREGKELMEAIEYCRERGLEFYAINSDFPDDLGDSKVINPRKINADVYIDDRNLGGLPDWGVIYQMIHNDKALESYNEETVFAKKKEEKKKKSWWK
jgi:hypothetical protein